METQIIVTAPEVVVTTTPAGVGIAALLVISIFLLLIPSALAIVISLHSFRQSRSVLEAALWGLVSLSIFPIGPVLYLLLSGRTARPANSP